MKLLATAALLALLIAPAGAAIVHDESVNGDLSTNPAAPTPIAFAQLSNFILGTTGNSGTVDRDYITFTIDSDRILGSLILHGLSPDNLAFAAFNSGSTSFVPSGSTAASFLAGIHPSGSHVGTDLMPLFVTSSVTGNSLSTPHLGPGTYSFLIQQTSPFLQSYSLEFVVDFVLPAKADSWGAVKSLYRE